MCQSHAMPAAQHFHSTSPPVASLYSFCPPSPRCSLSLLRWKWEGWTCMCHLWPSTYWQLLSEFWPFALMGIHVSGVCICVCMYVEVFMPTCMGSEANERNWVIFLYFVLSYSFETVSHQTGNSLKMTFQACTTQPCPALRWYWGYGFGSSCLCSSSSYTKPSPQSLVISLFKAAVWGVVGASSGFLSEALVLMQVTDNRRVGSAH